MNVATLAYHFGDKDGLYRTVVQRLHEELASAWPELPPGTPPEGVLRAVLVTAWSFCREHREHNRLLLRHVLDAGALPAVVVESWSERLISRAAGLVGALRPDWPEPRRRLMVSAVQHLLVRWSLEDPDQLRALLGGPDDVDGAVIDFVEHLVRSQISSR